MDYIIFRKAEKNFMRFSDGQIFVTADEEEIKEEFELDVKANCEPVILRLDYSQFFDSEGNQHQKVVVSDKDKGRVGFFTYPSHFDDDDAFYEALEDWGKDYIKNKFGN